MTWILRLNNMQASQIELTSPVAKAESREALLAFLERETVAPYRDGKWGKTFRAGGPLEWFNPPWGFQPPIIDVGTAADAARAAEREWEEFMRNIPTIT